MGSSTSKPIPESQQVFAAETSVRFGQDLINSLQKSPETDSTRAKSLELHIQSRVTAELEKLLAEKDQKLSTTLESVSKESSSPSPRRAPPSHQKIQPNLEPKEDQRQAGQTPPTWTEKPLLNRLAETLFGPTAKGNAPSPSSSPSAVLSQPSVAQNETQEEIEDHSPSRMAVQKEIDLLKRKLESRKKVPIDQEVVKAKNELITCLRINEAKPLDCWKEVEIFKLQVGKLEKAFVERTGA